MMQAFSTNTPALDGYYDSLCKFGALGAAYEQNMRAAFLT